MKTTITMCALLMLVGCKDKDQAGDWTKAGKAPEGERGSAVPDAELLMATDDYLSSLRILYSVDMLTGDQSRSRRAHEAEVERREKVVAIAEKAGRDDMIRILQGHRLKVSRLATEAAQAETAAGATGAGETEARALARAQEDYLKVLAIGARELLAK